MEKYIKVSTGGREAKGGTYRCFLRRYTKRIQARYRCQKNDKKQQTKKKNGENNELFL